MDIRHEPDQNRFAATTDHGTAELAYETRGDQITFTHTEVPEAARGEGIGSALAEAALTHARENDLGVVPSCPFVAAYVRDHPEWQDVLV